MTSSNIIQGVLEKMQPMFLAITLEILFVSLISFSVLDRLGGKNSEFISVYIFERRKNDLCVFIFGVEIVYKNVRAHFRSMFNFNNYRS